MTRAHSGVEGLTKKILIAMVAGAVFGLLFFYLPKSETVLSIKSFVLDGVLDLGGDIFIRSLKMLVVPLVFVSLVCGVCSFGSGSRIGVISIKTLAFYLTTTALAITLALLMAAIIGPGKGSFESFDTSEFQASTSPDIWQVLADIVPTNPVAAMAEGKMLQIILFAILFGIALAKVSKEHEQVRSFFFELDRVIMAMVMMLMRLAPYGVFCLIAQVFAEGGLDNISKLAKYFINVLLVLVLHALLTYGTLLTLLTQLSPLQFFRKIGRMWAFGFSTASSSATIPITMETVEEKLGVRNEVASFTVPLGATINMDGTAIMQGVATVFISQYFNVDLSLTDYLTVILTATLASIGTAGVPGVGLIMLTMVLTQVGLPVEGVAIIIGVDRILDMVRTAVNITGDAAVSVIVAKSEGMLDEQVFKQRN